MSAEDVDRIWDKIEASNRAWTSGHPERTAALFAPEAVMIAPGVAGVVEGRDALVNSYVEYAKIATTHAFEVTAKDVRVFEDLAVATYRFRVVYELSGVRHEEDGQETLVLRAADGDWRVVWRTQHPLPTR